MTKPAVWVQFAVKENRVDGKNLLHLKHTTSQKLFFFCTYQDFLWQIVLSCAQLKLMCSAFEFRSYYDKSDNFEQEEPRKNMGVDLNGFPSEK